MADVKDITGQQFGPWTVVSPCPRPVGMRTMGQFWTCKCVCGNAETISGARLRAGRMKRGCLACSGRLHKKGGAGSSPTYNSWRAMRERCLRPDSQSYPNYGGRGITICDRWRNSFVNFLADMGERPNGHTLDRIDVNGNYEPGNCRWATNKRQARNTRVATITDEQAEAIRRLYAFGPTQWLIATAVGVDRSIIASVVTGEHWEPEAA
jgi:hypothetical protein